MPRLLSSIVIDDLHQIDIGTSSDPINAIYVDTGVFRETGDAADIGSSGVPFSNGYFTALNTAEFVNTGTSTVTGHILPAVTNTVDLGSLIPAKIFRNLYVTNIVASAAVISTISAGIPITPASGGTGMGAWANQSIPYASSSGVPKTDVSYIYYDDDNGVQATKGLYVGSGGEILSLHIPLGNIDMVNGFIALQAGDATLSDGHLNVTAQDTTTTLIVNQTSTGDIADFTDNGTSVFQIGDGSTIGMYGQTPTVQASVINSPTGGSTQDSEARTAIDSIISALENIGIIVEAV